MSWTELNPIIFREKSSYDYGYVMLYFRFNDLPSLHYRISSTHLYTLKNDIDKFGLDGNPHTTLLNGLEHNVDVSDVDRALENFEYSNCELSNISLFEKKYDVLKYDVSGSNLHESNKALSKLPHTTEYSVYRPHLTIAYLKSGLGERYVKRFKKTKYNLQPKHIVYTKPNGKEYKIDIKYKK